MWIAIAIAVGVAVLVLAGVKLAGASHTVDELIAEPSPTPAPEPGAEHREAS